jgi:hypothetical protein
VRYQPEMIQPDETAISNNRVYPLALLVTVLILGLGGCSNSSRDRTPPVPGNKGQLAIVNVTDRSVRFSWTIASDNKTTQADLEYCVYYSAATPISTVRDAETHGILYQPCVLNTTLVTIVGLDKNTPYFFNVVVRQPCVFCR